MKLKGLYGDKNVTLESVSAALYGRCFRIVRIQPQLKR